MICSEKRTNFIKIMAALIVIIMLLAMLPTEVSAAKDYSTIRVRLNVSGSSLSVTVKGDYTIKEDDSIELKSGKSYTVSVASGKIRIKGSGVDETMSSVTFIRGKADTLSDNLLKVGSYSYLGNMKFLASGSSVRAINIIDLEQYLYGVVAAEMGNSFPIEALKAQAICARCYAIRKIDSSDSSDTYDTIGTASDQAYKGYNASYTKVIEAVDETRGKVLVHDGKIIEAYFTATNGGQTESPGNAWGGGSTKDAQYPYLPITEDPYDIESCLKNSSYEQRFYVPKDPADKRESDGRYSNAVLNDLQEKAYEKLKDEHDLSKVSDIRLISIESLENGTKRYPSSKKSMSYVDAEAKMTVQLPDDTEETVKVSITLMKKSGSSYSLAHDYMNGKFRMRYVTELENGWYVCNRRYGHGVGLSQMGAKNMADKHGMKYTGILEFYYPKTTLRTLSTGGGEDKDDPAQDDDLKSDYIIDGSYISGIPAGTQAEKFLKEMNVGKTEYTLYPADSDKPKTEGIVATGDIAKDGDGKKYTVVIYGDLNGDGEIALTDLLREQKYILEILKLEGAYKQAADATRDGEVNIADLLRIQKHLLGVTKIAQ